MKLYQKIIIYGTAIVCSLGYLGCEKSQTREQSQTQGESVKPWYISGTIKSEKLKNNILNNDEYLFSLSTEGGLKLLRNYINGPEMDGLLDPGDQVKFELNRLWNMNRENNFNVSLENIVEINGKPFSSKSNF